MDKNGIIRSNESDKTNYKYVADIAAKKCLVMFAVYLTGITAILRANFNYIDDMGRVYRGYKGWDNFSRYLSNFFSTIIHADSYLSDVSPLPQIIAVIIVSICSVMIFYILSRYSKFSIWSIVALLPLGLCPYFLECLAFKYDSPYMAMSILFAIFPLLFVKRKSYCALVVLGVLGTCMTYQASLGIFPMLVVLITFKEWNQGKDWKETLRFVIVSALAYLVGVIFFKIVIMRPVTEKYVDTSLLSLSEFVPTTINHYKQFFRYIFQDFKTEWLILITVLMLGFIWTAITVTKHKKLLSLVLAATTLFLMSLLCFGVYPFMAVPSYAPRAFIGVGVYLACISTFAIDIDNKGSVATRLACLVLSWCFFVFAFTYGNALYSQKVYTDFRITQVITDLNDIPMLNTEETIVVQVNNSIGQSPVIKKHPKDYRMLQRLIPKTFGNTFWASYGLMNYYGIGNITRDDSIDLSTYDLPIVTDTVFHTIRADQKHILIELK